VGVQRVTDLKADDGTCKIGITAQIENFGKINGMIDVN